MGIKTFNPYTPSRRHMTSSDFAEITTDKPEKSLVTSLKKNAGRNNVLALHSHDLKCGSFIIYLYHWCITN